MKTFEDLVFIFSPEDSELTSSVDEQIVFFNKWINCIFFDTKERADMVQ